TATSPNAPTASPNKTPPGKKTTCTPTPHATINNTDPSGLNVVCVVGSPVLAGLGFLALENGWNPLGWIAASLSAALALMCMGYSIWQYATR
ncbi:hypothetical protein, partial [Streptomonospora salina]|uniref:hypothetical protein n=1 Tax=Streptomonospora salina TaxID=104205 RepID=UPI0035EE36DA